MRDLPTRRIDGSEESLNPETASQISLRTNGASPSVASSNNNRFGFVSSALAIASICCSPPESVLANCERRSPSCGNRSSTDARSRCPGRAAAVRFSKTVRVAKLRLPSGAGAIPIRTTRYASMPESSAPPNRIEPSACGGAARWDMCLPRAAKDVGGNCGKHGFCAVKSCSEGAAIVSTALDPLIGDQWDSDRGYQL